ncbi:MAG: SURF1 family protein [Alphaproteobacteria bacterium]|nr:MAG: SURF1 family protein [Alphaproteobacteria bacterium]TAF14875.1 MAG: SURF1 family protein [Alphaproteobacteria bacterium]TAF41440.1 MAG: SURF1 family protein [Alphaproteobacteria bacterium]TAF75391.1 MAG: SURF1 family protein [Alphaproteobacteria bacterium]
MTRPSTRSSSRQWHKPHPVAWAFIILASTLLFGLCIWQMQRLQWKLGLIERISQGQIHEPLAALPSNDDLMRKDYGFARIYVTGEFLHDQEIHLAPRYYHSQLGYHILTPFRMTDGRIILLNRGWVMADHKDVSHRLEGQTQGMHHFVIMLRTDPDRNYFTPHHDPKKNIWFWRDRAAISKHLGLELVPVDADILYGARTHTAPIASDGLITLRNDHLGYALTWLLVGISGIVIFIIFHWRSSSLNE